MQPKEYGIVVFDTQPHGAKIYVDGQLLVDPNTEEALRTPERVLLIEGRRDFTFVLEGHKDVSGYIDVFAGVTVNVFRNLKPGISEEGWGEPEPQIWLSQQPTFQRSLQRSVGGIMKYTMEDELKTRYGIMEESSNIVTGYIVLTTYPEGATIYLDKNLVIDMDTGEPIKTPVELETYIGSHDLQFKLPGYCDEFWSVYVTSASTQYVYRNLQIC